MINKSLPIQLMESRTFEKSLKNELSTENEINKKLRTELSKLIHERINQYHNLTIESYIDKIRVTGIKRPLTYKEFNSIKRIIGLDGYTFHIKNSMISIDFYDEKKRF